jgi:hypothetical protein
MNHGRSGVRIDGTDKGDKEMIGDREISKKARRRQRISRH